MLLSVWLAGCAGLPTEFNTTGADRAVTPSTAVANIDAVRGQKVLWGGVIVNSQNLKDATQIEVLGYPLAQSGRPDRNDPPQHRFIVTRTGYLETADYTAGRLVTVVGKVKEKREGRVGEAPYAFPVVASEQLYLWPKDEAPRNEPRIHFGVGVIFR